MIKSKKAKKKSKKKVTFEKDLMKEDVNLDALQDEDEEAGGAILDDVKVKNVETSRPLYDDVKLPVHLTPASSIQYQDYMTSTLNMIPRIEYAYFQYEQSIQSQPESHVLNSILKSTKGRGIHGDHPTVARAVYESLKDHPELINLYMKNHN